ncbi:hypothetical protein KIN20_023649 [Parelaphostrongylus tenuis]|uniref:Uncharacterized protein n=1 Tax=Parelaphostrongylus tenuis TaxID=148309 RepID=A0AAD5N7D7_PARTN|nr:hypothetical protein KIN20_023649 [Parelaphostrongylus tenuis]
MASIFSFKLRIKDFNSQFMKAKGAKKKFGLDDLLLRRPPQEYKNCDIKVPLDKDNERRKNFSQKGRQS